MKLTSTTIVVLDERNAASRMTANRDGVVITFYSYNGGTGRTMAIANIAWILAANGKRVLVADWDLESPGLHRYFGPFLDHARFSRQGGIIDLIREFEWATAKESNSSSDWFDKYADVDAYAMALDWTFPSGGRLDILSAGRANHDYSASIQALDWDIFYEHLGGGQFLDALRAAMKRRYDVTLIDSRPGVSDVAEICTVQLPDELVVCFTFSEQSMVGAVQMARLVQQRASARQIRVLPVPMRVDAPDSDRARAGRIIAMRRLPGLPAGLTEQERSTYWAEVTVPYSPSYAYEELLATFAERPGQRPSLLASYEALTAVLTRGAVTGLPAMDDAVRDAVLARFTRP